MTLQTSPTQLQHRCFIFWFAWLIKVRSIVVLHPLLSWYSHLCFLFYLYFPLNPTMVPTSEVILIPQKRMTYCFICHGQLFFTGFHLQTEPYSCVTIAINWNKEDLSIMSSLNQDHHHQSSDVLLSIWYCDKVDRRWAKGINSAGTMDSAKMSIIYETPQKHWYTWPDQVDTAFTNEEVGFSLGTNFSSKY